MTTFKTIFVTVGTTKFDALIREVDSVVFQRFITETLKTTTLIVQYGNSAILPESVKIQSCIDSLVHRQSSGFDP